MSTTQKLPAIDKIISIERYPDGDSKTVHERKTRVAKIWNLWRSSLPSGCYACSRFDQCCPRTNCKKNRWRGDESKKEMIDYLYPNFKR